MVLPQSGADLEKVLEDRPIMEPSVVGLAEEPLKIVEPDGVTFDAMFEMLNGDHPVVAVGTVSPEWYDTLTKDPYRSARTTWLSVSCIKPSFGGVANQSRRRDAAPTSPWTGTSMRAESSTASPGK